MTNNIPTDRNIVFDIIIALVKGKIKDDRLEYVANGKTFALHSVSYLLGQTIRQYVLPESHILVSEGAQKLWMQISDEDIKTKHHRDSVICKNKTAINVPMYNGSRNAPAYEQLTYGEKFPFNNVFHDEHMIPIKIIVQQLVELKELTYANVERILNQMYVCKILKDEDRRIKPKSNRPNCLIKVVDQCYTTADITVVDWKKIKADYLLQCGSDCTNCPLIINN